MGILSGARLMALTIDANVLIEASNTVSPHQSRLAGAIREAAEGTEPVYLFWPVVFAYLRVTTHARVFEQPLSLSEAHANVANLAGQENVTFASERTGFWEVYQRVAGQARIRGALVHDAHIVALMLQHEVRTIWTRDRDFRKFDGIRVVDPFD